MATPAPSPSWFGLAGVELASLLRDAMKAAERRDCRVFTPASWQLLAVLEQAADEWRAAREAELARRMPSRQEGGTDVRPEGGTETKLVSVNEAADILQISNRAVRMRIRRGRLRAVWVDDRYLIDRDDVEAA